MITIQQLAAFSTLLLRGGDETIWAAGCDIDRIQEVFKSRRLLYLELGGLDYTPELIQLYIDITPYIRNNQIPPDAVLANHGFYGVYMGWFWKKISELGEEGYFTQPPGIFKLEAIHLLHYPGVNDGWVISFLEGGMHEMYSQSLRSAATRAKVLDLTPTKRHVWPFLQRFKQE